MATSTVLGVEYCTGYFDDSKTWRKGFYCPRSEDGVTGVENSKDIFCCGTQTSKHCCERKEGFTTINSGVYVSYSTLVYVAVITFVATVLLTGLAIFCWRRYWKYRDRGSLVCDAGSSASSSMRENHFYRMTCSSSNAPLVPFSTSFHSNPGAIHSPSVPTVSLINPLLHTYLSPAIAEQQQQHNHYRIMSQSPSDTTTTSTTTTGTSAGHVILQSLSILEPPAYPPPPYQSTTSINELNVVQIQGLGSNQIPANVDQRNNRNLTGSNNISNNNNVSNESSLTNSTIEHSNQRRKRMNQQTLWRKLSQ